jgi:trk system potassium uptake protein
MNILILGAGEIGLHMAGLLCEKSHNVCLVESDERLAAQAGDALDARVIGGNGASVSVLEEAGIADCDVFFGLSGSDTTNLVAGSLARALGAKKAVCRVHAAVHREQWMFDYKTRFDVDHLFSAERLAAIELAKHIRNPGSLLVEEIARGRIELQQTLVPPDSGVGGRSLRELSLPPRVRVGLIRRGEETIIPDGEARVLAGDVVTLFGATRALEGVLPLFQSGRVEREEVRVVIFGGGGYGFALAQMLEGGPRFRTRIFERDPERCALLAATLRRTTLINADATSIHQLREEQVGGADFFVAATADDEDNVMTCLQAADLGVAHCLTLVHRADYADAITRAGPKMGILAAVSPRVATGRELMRFATSEPFQTLVDLPGDIAVIEIPVHAGGALDGRRIAEVPWPKGCGIVALTHKSSAGVPSADDVLEAGDLIAAMVSAEARREIGSLLR